MNRAELKQIAADEGLGPVAFLDEERVRADAVVLEPTAEGWSVYITTERAGAVASTVREFGSEADALDHVLVKLRQGARARQSMSDLRSRRSGPRVQS